MKPPLAAKPFRARAAMHPCPRCFCFCRAVGQCASTIVYQLSGGSLCNKQVFPGPPRGQTATLLRFAGQGLGPPSIPGACAFTGAKAKQHGTRDSQMITQFTTNRAQTSLACLIGREGALSGWYDRAMPYSTLLWIISRLTGSTRPNTNKA